MEKTDEITTARVWVFGDNVSTDEIIAGKYLAERNIEKLASHTFENLKENFAREARAGDVIIAGKNFGSGSSREQAVLVFKVRGIKIIVAESYSRIFFRNCVNNGILPLKTQERLCEILKDRDIIQIDFSNQQIYTAKLCFGFEKPSDVLLKIWEAGGLIEYLKMQDTPPFQ
ncbi:MAG: 3-isopropylmalate dehydratase small subunit [Thermoplasmata archaeon]